MSENLSKLIAIARELGRDDKTIAETVALAECELQVLLCSASLPCPPVVESSAMKDVRATMLKGLSDLCLLTSKAAAGLNHPLLEARALSVQLYAVANGMQCTEKKNDGHPSFPEADHQLTLGSALS